MKTIKLIKLELENFKCFKKLEIDFNNGEDLVIKGANGSGKTTIMDALNWLLFKKNSHGDQDFSLKPLDKNGNSKKSVVISVYGEFLVDDEIVSFKRTMEEQWTRKRGSEVATFTGNTYAYEINGVPSQSEKGYKEAVAELCEESLFRLLTNPHYFSSLDKKEKRKILLSALKENVDDLVICDNNEELHDLRNHLLNNTVEELQAIKKKEIKELTKKLNEYTPRIDELSKITDDELTEDETNEKIEQLNIEIDIVKDKIKAFSGDSESSNLALINQLNAELLQLKSELLVAENENPNKKNKQERLNELENELADFKRQIRENELQIMSNKNEIEEAKNAINIYTQKGVKLNADITELRNKSKETAQLKFDENETICPCCKRLFTEDMIAEIKNNFNIQKSQQLEEIKTKGLAIKKEIEENTVYLNLAKDNLNELFEKKKELEKNNECLKISIDECKELLFDLENAPILENEAILGLKSAISNKEQQIISAKSNVQNNMQNKAIICDLEYELDKLQKEKFTLEQNIENRIRIVALYEMQEHDSALRVQAERILALCDILTTKKCQIIEDEVNKMFNNVKFKLFETQINGGIAEVCYATVNGVPYDDVNSAGKINAGLDIIKTLQNENEIQAFIFIDNAESITDIMAMNNQMITLYVSKEDEKLSFENK